MIQKQKTIWEKDMQRVGADSTDVKGVLVTLENMGYSSWLTSTAGGILHRSLGPLMQVAGKDDEEGRTQLENVIWEITETMRKTETDMPREVKEVT